MTGLRSRCVCRVADLTSGDTVTALAQTVLATAAPRFCLAAFSFGGYVAQEILRTASDRVERVALIGTSCKADTPERQAERMALVVAARAPGRFAGITDRLPASFVHPDRLDDTALVERIKAMTQRVGRDAFIRQTLVPRVDGSAALRAIRCPALVMCGLHDRVTPWQDHRDMAALIAGAELRYLADCGHLAPMERPAAVTEALGTWLD